MAAHCAQRITPSWASCLLLRHLLLLRLGLGLRLRLGLLRRLRLGLGLRLRRRLRLCLRLAPAFWRRSHAIMVVPTFHHALPNDRSLRSALSDYVRR